MQIRQQRSIPRCITSLKQNCMDERDRFSRRSGTLETVPLQQFAALETTAVRRNAMQPARVRNVMVDFGARGATIDKHP